MRERGRANGWDYLSQHGDVFQAYVEGEDAEPLRIETYVWCVLDRTQRPAI